MTIRPLVTALASFSLSAIATGQVSVQVVANSDLLATSHGAPQRIFAGTDVTAGVTLNSSGVIGTGSCAGMTSSSSLQVQPISGGVRVVTAALQPICGGSATVTGSLRLRLSAPASTRGSLEVTTTLYGTNRWSVVPGAESDIQGLLSAEEAHARPFEVPSGGADVLIHFDSSATFVARICNYSVDVVFVPTGGQMESIGPGCGPDLGARHRFTRSVLGPETRDLTLSAMPTSTASGAFVIGTSAMQTPLPAPGCTLWTDPLLVVMATPSGGSAQRQIDLSRVTGLLDVRAQFVGLTLGSTPALNASDAVRIRVP